MCHKWMVVYSALELTVKLSRIPSGTFFQSLSLTSLDSVAQNSMCLVLSPLFGSFDRCPPLASLSHRAGTDLDPRHFYWCILTTHV